MPVAWHKSKLVKVIEETYQTRRFFFEFPELDEFHFDAGQFVQFDMPIGESPKERRRSYSIASAPTGKPQLEFVIVKLEGGAGTGYLFDKMQVGDVIEMSDARGKMTLHDPVDYDICYICTGTGIAPFRSQMHDMINKGTAHRKVDLVFGTRAMKDMLYWDEMRGLGEKLSNFEYHPTLSREDADGCRRGYVHAVYEELYQNRKGDNDVRFFICGWGDMIKEARNRLSDMGFDRKQLHFEIYG
jgi:ferredoxin-NADP reductase